MTNLERWENFFKRKGWKYKKVTSKWGDRLMIKTYHMSMRCHMFVSETHLNFCFYKGYMLPKATGVDKLQCSKQRQYCLAKRNGTLHMFNKGKQHIQNMGMHGPSQLFMEITGVVSRRNIDSPKWISGSSNYITTKETKRISKTARNKILQTLEFFLRLNKFKFKDVSQKSILELSYPGLKNFPVKDCLIISKVMRKELGFNDLCKKVFGHKSKIINKVLTDPSKHHVPKIEVGYILKPFLNRGEMEGLLPLINTSIMHGIRSTKDIPRFRKFFKQFTSKQLVHLFSQTYTEYDVADSMHQWDEHPTKITIPEKVQNWHFIHEEITRQYRKLREADYEFNIKPSLKAIHGVQVDNATIVVPHTRHELVDWGTKLNNCIAGYHSHFNQGRTILLGIKEDNEIKYNVEINGGAIRQFMGNYNRWVEPDVVEKFKPIFLAYKLIGG